MVSCEIQSDGNQKFSTPMESLGGNPLQNKNI